MIKYKIESFKDIINSFEDIFKSFEVMFNSFENINSNNWNMYLQRIEYMLNGVPFKSDIS